MNDIDGGLDCAAVQPVHSKQTMQTMPYFMIRPALVQADAQERIVARIEGGL